MLRHRKDVVLLETIVLVAVLMDNETLLCLEMWYVVPAAAVAGLRGGKSTSASRHAVSPCHKVCPPIWGVKIAF